MGKTNKDIFDRIRKPSAPPTRVMRSKHDYRRANNYLHSSFYLLEEDVADIDPDEGGEENI
jgi:hypothetical protein